jgi:hypothetical protein
MPSTSATTPPLFASIICHTNFTHMSEKEIGRGENQLING